MIKKQKSLEKKFRFLLELDEMPNEISKNLKNVLLGHLSQSCVISISDYGQIS